MTGSPLASFPLAPGIGGSGADPFEGAAFGFEVPQGDPGEIRAAGTQAGALGMSLSFRGQDVTRAASEATADWSGHAQGAFADLASQTVSALHTNSDAFTRAGTTMTTLADQLERAQQATRRAAQQCATYQKAMTMAQTEATTQAQAANGYTRAAASAAHPATASSMSTQATQAQGRADAAGRAAGAARHELEMWRRRGQDAASTYQQQAQRAARELTGAAGDLHPLRSGEGAPAPPVPVCRGDVTIAQRAFDRVKDLPASALSKNPGKAIDQAAGRHLTPGQLAALYEMAKENRDAGKGSLIDGAGGFVNFATGGLVRFGNPRTGRYKGGEIAGAIPVDPEALIADGERGLAKIAGKEGERVAEKDGGRDAAGVGVNRGDGRDSTGKFTGTGGYGKDAEARGLQTWSRRTGLPVQSRQVRSSLPGQPSRYYDGLAQKPDGTWIGIEVKSGGASLTPGQKGFDSAVGPSHPATAVLDGKVIKITEVSVQRVR